MLGNSLEGSLSAREVLLFVTGSLSCKQVRQNSISEFHFLVCLVLYRFGLIQFVMGAENTHHLKHKYVFSGIVRLYISEEVKPLFLAQ